MDKLRQQSRLMHPETNAVSRTNVITALTDADKRVTQPYYSKYEYTTIIGTRAQQIAQGSKPLVSLDSIQTSNPDFIWKVAEKEIVERKLPFIIHRRLPDGHSEYWSTSELGIIW